jgi:hypothetical protein
MTSWSTRFAPGPASVARCHGSSTQPSTTTDPARAGSGVSARNATLFTVSPLGAEQPSAAVIAARAMLAARGHQLHVFVVMVIVPIPREARGFRRS